MSDPSADIGISAEDLAAVGHGPHIDTEVVRDLAQILK